MKFHNVEAKEKEFDVLNSILRYISEGDIRARHYLYMYIHAYVNLYTYIRIRIIYLYIYTYIYNICIFSILFVYRMCPKIDSTYIH